MSAFYYAFLLTSCFSYTKFFGVGLATDTQFYTFAASLLVLFVNIWIRKRLSKDLFSFYCYFLVIVFVLTIVYLCGGKNDTFRFYRGIFPYLSFPTVSVASYFMFGSWSKKRIVDFLVMVYYLWILVGIVQIVSPYFLTGWTHRLTTGGGRGAISFASEPAYFSITILFISLIIYLLSKKQRYLFLTLATSFLVARSMVGVVYSLCLLLLVNWGGIVNFMHSEMRRSNVLNIAFILVIVLISLYVVSMFSRNSRLASLINSVISNPLQLLITDGSLNIRVTHLLISIKGSIDHFLMPQGVTTWWEYHTVEIYKYPNFFVGTIRHIASLGGRIGNDKIVSMIGALIYETGFLSIPIFGYFYTFTKNVIGKRKLFIFLMIMGLNGLNMSHPLLGVLVGYCIHYQHCYVSTPKRIE